ncbi:hypothetical protein [Ochrobactrum sp. EDr1-4]|uniref:hypothetical protein n=1 Tax=Ochrobactrum sp. EDr1-4 TaxID=3368622 RepID=UPI003BA01906
MSDQKYIKNCITVFFDRSEKQDNSVKYSIIYLLGSIFAVIAFIVTLALNKLSFNSLMVFNISCALLLSIVTIRYTYILQYYINLVIIALSVATLWMTISNDYLLSKYEVKIGPWGFTTLTLTILFYCYKFGIEVIIAIDHFYPGKINRNSKIHPSRKLVRREATRRSLLYAGRRRRH